MTKIVVAYDLTDVEVRKEIFEGDVYAEASSSYGHHSEPLESILRIYKDKNHDDEIASFKHWIYWRYTE